MNLNGRTYRAVLLLGVFAKIKVYSESIWPPDARHGGWWGVTQFSLFHPQGEWVGNTALGDNLLFIYFFVSFELCIRVLSPLFWGYLRAGRGGGV